MIFYIKYNYKPLKNRQSPRKMPALLTRNGPSRSIEYFENYFVSNDERKSMNQF